MSTVPRGEVYVDLVDASTDERMKRAYARIRPRLLRIAATVADPKDIWLSREGSTFKLRIYDEVKDIVTLGRQIRTATIEGLGPQLAMLVGARVSAYYYPHDYADWMTEYASETTVREHYQLG